MNGDATLGFLKRLYQKAETSDRGAALRRALLSVAVPAAAGLAMACYGVPMEEYTGPNDDVEVCSNGVDDDSDGATDCDDSECAHLELCLGCTDGIDNDDNDRTDCADSSCSGLEVCQGPGACADDADNDGDGLADCMDSDCAGSGDCI